MLPDYRLTKAKTYIKIGKSADDDPGLNRLILFLSKSSEDTLLSKAYNIYLNSYRKSWVESYLLCASVEETAKAFEMSIDIVRTYAEYFFDPSVFEDKLAKLEYVGQLQDGEERTRKHWAITLGKEYIDWRLGNVLQISSEEVTKKLLSDAYVMSRKSIIGDGSTPKDRAEAFRWAQLAAKLAEGINKDSPPKDLALDLIVDTVYANLDEPATINADRIIKG